MSDAAPTVLLVEDDPQIRRFLRVTLPAHGYRLVEARTGSRRPPREPPRSSSST